MVINKALEMKIPFLAVFRKLSGVFLPATTQLLTIYYLIISLIIIKDWQ